MVTFDGKHWYVDGVRKFSGPSTVAIMDAAGDDEIPIVDAVRWAWARFAGVEDTRAVVVNDVPEEILRAVAKAEAKFIVKKALGHKILVSDLFYMSDVDDFIPRDQLPDGVAGQC